MPMRNLRALPRTLFSFIKSLVPTSKSPTTAVTSNIFKPNSASMAFTSFIATLIPPPTTVLSRSRTANKPLNVRFRFLAVSSDMMSFSEKP